MMLGRKPDAREVAALDAYFVTVCDHGMNASTFTTRVVASTQADLFAAVTAGYCALTGPLHGGAPEPVLEMLDAIGTRERIKPWVDSALARGERLMGFGHRVYRVRDPRADVLKGAIERLAGDGTDLAVRRRSRGLYPRGAAAEKSGPPARHQCGVLHRDPARRAEDPAAGLYADLRGGPRRRLDGARPRAAARRPADTAEFGLYRPDAGVRWISDDSGAQSRCRPANAGTHSDGRVSRAVGQTALHPLAAAYGPCVRRDDGVPASRRAPRSSDNYTP